jgi:hypothetical protein
VWGGAGSRNRGESGRQAPPESSQEVSEETGRAGGLDEGGVGVAGAGGEVSPRGQSKKKHKAFGALNEVDQTRVNAMAGVLRLARALRKSGIETTVGLRVDKSVDALIVQVPGLVDSESVAARLAVGKHLLETCLELPLIVRAVPAAQKVLELPKREDPGQARPAASD